MEQTLDVGNGLLAVETTGPHGRFRPWLQPEFGRPEPATRNGMRIAGRFGPKSAIVADLPIRLTAVCWSAAPSIPDDARGPAIRRAARGDGWPPVVAK